MLRAFTQLCLLGCSLLGCSSVVDSGPVSDCVTGPPVLPSDSTCARPALTAASTPAWLSSVMCSPNGIEDSFEQELETHRGDEPITDAFFVIVNAGWQFDGMTATCTDWQPAAFALGMIRALRDPNAFVRLDALVWRPLPSPAAELDFLEQKAGEAIACIPTSEAQAEATKLAATHPSRGVRESVAGKLEREDCAFYQ